ncbi:MAG: adenosylmethionine--8-amino-7-oxononanoate transaminase [Myxococcota bacterium]|nr:adenosylmethionine--8-amino-7-oxononanoate transaminase [Myxococcota bacterium]
MLSRERIVELDKKLLWHPYTPMRRYIDEVDPVVAVEARGFHLIDANGQRLIDANGSWWVSLLGHNHPRLMAALKAQAEKLAHCAFANITHEPAVRLAEQLLPRCGKSYSRLFFSDDGSTAVEAALRMAYQYWQNLGRPEKRRFVSLEHAFHGETVGVASVSGTQVFHKVLGPLLFDCIRLPSPGQAIRGERPWHEVAFEAARTIIDERADEMAAVIVEPLVQGAAGMLMYPAEYLTGLRRLTEERDVLLIDDEVFMGYGRAGSFLAQHQAGIEADIVCLAKGFSGGVLPMAATVVTDRVFDAFLGGPATTLWYGHSFTGNPLGAAVALEVLAVLEDERILENLGPRACALDAGLARISVHPLVRDSRRTGVVAAFTLDPGGESHADYLSDLGWKLSAAARRRGALVRPLGNVVYFVPPLNAAVEDIETLFDITDAALREVF